MKYLKFILVLVILLPAVGFTQLKKDVDKPNISKSLQNLVAKDAVVGFLDPSRFQMSHSLSMSYLSFGGGGAMINTYVNTLNYRISDNLFLTTDLGIMNSPYNSLPGNSNLNDYEFFGAAELKFLPS
jgi:hypothetical protein